MEAETAARLRKLAHAAPRGPWHTGRSSGYGSPNVANADGPLLSTGNAKKRTRTEQAALATYVAAIDPDTLLALLDLLDEYATSLHVLVAAVERLEASTVGLQESA
jgi:hypothetical protein